MTQWRVLWTDHAVYTRMYIIESLNNSSAADEAAARLLKNQEDIGNAIKPYYGDAAGDKLTALLKEHITIAVAIINDVKAKNATAQAADEAKWTQNADEIAAFLASANPNWPEKDVKDLMYMHLSTTKDELVARYTGDGDHTEALALDGVIGDAGQLAEVDTPTLDRPEPVRVGCADGSRNAAASMVRYVVIVISWVLRRAHSPGVVRGPRAGSGCERPGSGRSRAQPGGLRGSRRCLRRRR